jgi:hypothetical protein
MQRLATGDSPAISNLGTGDVQTLKGAKTSSKTIKPRQAGVLRRILDVLSAWDRQQKEREIGELLARSGGRLTDELERRIMQREMAADWSAHR